ncbi:MAG: DUF433 domain-containing protein [Desulfobacterales bacterium]|nr:DUF433 domain-containing protein [Desulfobacterales bacterium]MBF0398851.1 DUF433 domain-containing protein [Desulfobacterales bacterium]
MTYRPTVMKTNRGLSIAGTRITLYQIMDYIKDNEPPEIIRDHFRLTIKQTADVLNYINTHYDEIDKDYQRISKQADENKKYWTERNKDRFTEIYQKPEYIKIRTKLDEWKARLLRNDKYTDRP